MKAAVMFFIIIAVAVLQLLAAPAAYADGIFDTITSSYKSATDGWFSALQGYAQTLFWLLAAIELAWAGITWVLEKDHMSTFTAALIKKIMAIGFFYALLLYANTWIPAIIKSFETAGQSAGKFPLSGITPSSVVDLGINTASVLLEKIKNLSLWDSAGTIIIAGWSAIFIVFGFVVIAAQLMIALIESYIVIGAGVLFLGFGASRFTTDFAHKYVCYAFAIGVKLFILYLLLAIGTTQAETWGNLLAQADVTQSLNTLFAVLGGSLILAFLSFQIPNLAASMLSGAPSLTAGSAMQSVTLMSAAALGAGAAVVSPVLSEARGGVRALSAGYGTARAGDSAPVTASVKGLGYAAGAMGTEAVRGVAAAVGLSKPSEFAAGARSLGARAANRLDAKSQILREQKAAISADSFPGSTAGSSVDSTASSASQPGSTSGGPGTPPSGAPPAGTSPTPTPTGSTPSRGPASPGPGVSGMATAGSTASAVKALSGLRRVQPPQIPHDYAPPATVTIKLKHPED
jgi:type IV secretion system protein TrbL